MFRFGGGLLASILALWSGPAAACACDDQLSLKVAKAQSIFYGRVLEARIPGSWDDLGPIGREASSYPAPLDYYLILRYQIVEFLKGRPDPDGFVISTIHIPGLCAPPILAGLHYVIFTDGNGYSDSCVGLFQLGWQDPQHARIQEELELIRDLVARSPAPVPGDETPE